jgi:pimeloyl-ACP methyl ester carboxylesterase
MISRPNIVLIHGGFADGYHVTAPQFPMTALADDVARLRELLDLQDGPTIIAAHSYGGQIMTALGTDPPNVASLVSVAAFGLDQGESLRQLLSHGPVTPRWRGSSPTSTASAGCPRTTSSTSSPSTPIQSRQR